MNTVFNYILGGFMLLVVFLMLAYMPGWLFILGILLLLARPWRWEGFWRGFWGLPPKQRYQPVHQPTHPRQHKTYDADGHPVYHYYDASGIEIDRIETRPEPAYYRRLTMEEGWGSQR